MSTAGVTRIVSIEMTLCITVNGTPEPGTTTACTGTQGGVGGGKGGGSVPIR